MNLDPKSMLAQLREGKKIVEIAQEQGISRGELIEELVELAQDSLFYTA